MNPPTNQDAKTVDEILENIDVTVTYKAGHPVKTSIGTITAKQALLTLIANEAVGDDKPAIIAGKEYRTGDTVPIDLSGGVGDKTFNESVMAIQTNGENLAKSEIRTRLNNLFNSKGE